VSYWEQPTPLPGVVLWGRTATSEERRSLILPDGCLDVIWDGHRLFVAGPDTTARWHASEPGTQYVGARFSAGTGASVLAVGASQVRDQCPDLSDIVEARRHRPPAGELEADPARALARWADERLRLHPAPALGAQIHAYSAVGLPVAETASRVGFSERQLRRRCEDMFGYGPRRLGRILRLGRTLEAARGGLAWSTVAAQCGYADQAHLVRETQDLTGLPPTRLVAALSR
jgi:AraC-like DNA-binding protein